MAENTQKTDNKNTESAENRGAASAQAKENSVPKNVESKSNDAAQQTNAPKKTDGESKGVTEQVKEKTGEIAGQVKEKAASMIGEQKSNLAAGISGIADGIRQIGEDLGGDGQNQITAFAGKYGDTVAAQIEKVSGYVEDRKLGEIVQDVEKLARRNPTLFVGGAFLLGVLAARFLKSSGAKQSNRRRS